MTEKEIYIGCLSNDTRAQNQLHKKYYDTLLKTTIKYTKNLQDAEDCLQEAFARIFQKLHTFNNEGSFEGWMRTVARNIALKKYVGLRDKMEFVNDTSSYEYMRSYTPTPYSVLEHKNIMNRLKDVPEKMSRVFYMNEIEGYSHDEIANIMKIKSSTSRSQLMKAKNKLKELINS